MKNRANARLVIMAKDAVLKGRMGKHKVKTGNGYAVLSTADRKAVRDGELVFTFAVSRGKERLFILDADAKGYSFIKEPPETITVKKGFHYYGRRPFLAEAQLIERLGLCRLEHYSGFFKEIKTGGMLANLD